MGSHNLSGAVNEFQEENSSTSLKDYLWVYLTILQLVQFVINDL